MNILGLIGQIFKPAMEAVDAVHTSTEEKLTKKAELLAIQISFLEKGLEYEKSMLKAKADIIVSEAKSDSWITRSWRPITMLSFVAAILAYWFGLTPDDIPEDAINDMFTLVQIGLGGYVVGRSAEKVAVPLVKAFKTKEKT